jgi:ABC-type lipoprotein release transport system permease subunit
MTWAKLWAIAYRDLVRNRRRSFFSLLAVGLGLALLIVLNGYIAGVMEDSLQNSIRLQTGHVQLRAPTYEAEKMSLQWKDLLADAGALAARASELDQVMAAAPLLRASGNLSTMDDSAGVQLLGIEPSSGVYQPIQQAIVEGQYLEAVDREGILVGKRLADSLGLSVGRGVNLAVVDADGRADEGVFEIRGLYATGIPSYDETMILLPLSKAQAFTRTGDRASAVVMLLHDQADAELVAEALREPGLTALTWEDMNAFFLQTVETGLSFYYLMDLVVMLIVAVIIANTLLMTVFERVREMGILAALGMKGRHIRLMILFEATILGLAGILVGIALGSAGVAYLASVGIEIGDVATAVGGVAIGTTLYARFVPGTFLALSLATLAIILLAALYPAWFASRVEPVRALHTV